MCGIIGSFPIQDTRRVARGLKRIAHRGPDAQKLVEFSRAALGHSRLAILDVAEGHQPMRHENQWIVFNGEIYNYKDLQPSLPYQTQTDSDTEVLLKLYATHGPSCVEQLDGMFAFAIVDKDHLFLARDPLGIKPLYYAIQDECLYFASEIKALLPFTARVKEFPPGHWWHTAHGFYNYYPLEKLERMRTTSQREPGAQDLERLRGTLNQAVEKRLIADEGVPVGISLSGGLDSSIIVALARQGRESLDTFVVGMEGSPDLEASHQVARFMDTRHHARKYTFSEMLEALPEIIYYLESFDAALVRSAIPNYFLARLASDYVKVILTGEGADELFAGYEYLWEVQEPEALQRELWTITSRLHNTNLQRTDRMTMAHGLEGRVPFLDMRMVETAFKLPPRWKSPVEGGEKALLRNAFAGLLPESIVHRPKAKFSKGTGSANMMAEYARELIPDREFAAGKEPVEGIKLRSKEELLYYRIFRDHFGDTLPPGVVGRTRSVTSTELN